MLQHYYNTTTIPSDDYDNSELFTSNNYFTCLFFMFGSLFSFSIFGTMIIYFYFSEETSMNAAGDEEEKEDDDETKNIL